VVLNGMTGSVGLAPTLARSRPAARLALANKESLVAGGPLLPPHMDLIVPVDSEHSALAQCLRGGRASEVRRLVLTGERRAVPRPVRASCGSDAAQAMAPPTWDMGPVITINSATLVNKGLEVIEAHLLFGTPYDAIDVVVHPSVAGPLDGGVRRRLDARAGEPARTCGCRSASRWAGPSGGAAVVRPGLDAATTWEFEPLDEAAFPAVALCKAAGERGGTSPAVLNAANEVCVQASSTGGCRSSGSWTRSPRSWTTTPSGNAQPLPTCWSQRSGRGSVPGSS
jgi:1-deoxy-D-xylulose-5-phosphate reductoisomerase